METAALTALEGHRPIVNFDAEGEWLAEAEEDFADMALLRQIAALHLRDEDRWICERIARDEW